MVTITGGSDATFVYTPDTAPDSTPTVVVKDASGTTVTLANAPAADGTDYILTIEGSESLALVGQTCTIAWTWAYTDTEGTHDVYDVETFMVTTTQVTTGLPDIATSGDLARYGYSTAAYTMLPRASARVRGYTGQDITSGTSTVSLRYPFLLPQRPVVSVTSVTHTDDAGTVTTLSTDSYSLENQRIVLSESWTSDTDDGLSPFQVYRDELLSVTYTHGYTTLPDELVEVVCSIANRMYSAPAGMASGIQSEAADGESITWGSDAYGGVAELTGAEKRVLDRVLPSSRRRPSVAMTL